MNVRSLLVLERLGCSSKSKGSWVARRARAGVVGFQTGPSRRAGNQAGALGPGVGVGLLGGSFSSTSRDSTICRATGTATVDP